MSEKKLGKRLLTWVLVLVMTLSTLPLNVLADWEGWPGGDWQKTYSVSFSKGTSANCTVWYSEVDGELHEFTGTISHTGLTGGYGIVFFVAPADGYALTDINGDGSTFNSIVDNDDPTECDFWVNGNKNNLNKNAGFSDDTIKNLINTAKTEKKCVAAFLYTRIGNGDKDLNVTLNFTTKKLATVAKEAVAAYKSDGTPLNLSNVSIGDKIEYKLTVSYNSSADSVEYSNIKLTDSLTNDEFELNGPAKQNSNIEEHTVFYEVKAEDIKDEQISNKAVLTYDYKAKFNSSSGKAEDEAVATVKVTKLVSYIYTGSVLPSGANDQLPAPASHKNGETVSVASKPEIMGYTFEGWTTTDTTLSEDGKSFTMPLNNVTFTGSWTANTDVSYTVKYLEEGTNAVLKDAKTVSGKTFNTTVTETAEEISGYEVVRDSSQTITLDEYGKVITFYYKAVQPTTVTLTFDANGGAWESAVDGYTMGEDNKTAAISGEKGVLKLSDIGTHPTQEGYIFKGWYESKEYASSLQHQVGFLDALVPSDTTLYAGWEKIESSTNISCKIVQHFIDADGKSSNIDKFTSNAIAKDTPISDLIAEYAKNQGTYWYNASETTVNGTPLTSGQKLTEDATIDLYYYLDTWNDKNDSTTEGDGIPDMYQAVVKFESGNPLFGEVKGSNLTQVFTLTDSNGNHAVSGSVTPSLNGVEATPLNAAVHRFSMWTKNSGEERVDPTEPITVNGGSTTVFKAQFEKIPTTYTVTYELNGGTTTSESITFSGLTYGTSTPTINNPTKAGYTFKEWSPKVDDTVTKNVTYKAIYTQNMYTVTYDLDGGTTTSASTSFSDLTYGTSTPTINNPTKAGYTFKEWSPEVAKTVIDNATYTATWTADAATIKFVTNGGSTVADMSGKTDDAITSRTMPTTTKSGYTFAGWFDNEGLTGTAVTQLPETFPAGTTTYYAKWTRNSRPVTPPSRPTTPTIEIDDDDALGLNTTDHFAYIVGYGNGEVRPQNNITRAEVATIFFRLLTDDVRDANLSKTNRYSDVADTAWYNTAVSTLSAMGIITGYPDGTFRPNAAITRAEFAAIAARFDTNGDKTTAAFTDIASHWAKDEISIAANNGWIKGYEDNTFRPQRDITRAETMTLVNRVLNRQPETEDDLLPNMTVWTDNADKNAWYYLAVQEATNSHYYEFKTNSVYEKWTELRETRDWTQLEK